MSDTSRDPGPTSVGAWAGETLAYGALGTPATSLDGTAETLLVPSPGGAAGGTTLPTGRTLGSQVTVLPRVTLQGDRPAFITELRERYEILGPLGEGGVGEVLSARDHDIDRRVALKRIRAQVESPGALGGVLVAALALIGGVGFAVSRLL